MPNTIKYSTSSIANSTLVGSVAFGWAGYNYGPSNTTGWYQGVTPPSGGYVVYATSASQIISATVASNDTDLITIGKQISGQNFTSSAQAQTYLNANGFAVATQDYSSSAIITTNLLIYLDAGNAASYPGTGTIWTSLVNGYSGSLQSGVGYSSSNGGVLTFNGGVNSFVSMSSTNPLVSYTNNFSIEAWYQSNNNQPGIMRTGLSSQGFVFGYYSTTGTAWKVTKYGVVDLSVGSIPQNTSWHQAVLTYSGTTGTRVYIDGTLSGNVANTTNVRAGTDFLIGKSEATNLSGSMGIFRAYNSVLSAADVLQNFNADKGRFGL